MPPASSCCPPSRPPLLLKSTPSSQHPALSLPSPHSQAASAPVWLYSRLHNSSFPWKRLPFSPNCSLFSSTPASYLLSESLTSFKGRAQAQSCMWQGREFQTPQPITISPLLKSCSAIYICGYMAEYLKRCLDSLCPNMNNISWHYYLPATFLSILLIVLI